MSHLKDNMVTHTGERSYSCSYCEAAFTQPGTRNRHERILHLKIFEEFKCDVCSKTFNEKGNLKNHMVIHGERPFACSYCEATFFYNANKKKHEQAKHNKTSTFKCDICSETFDCKTCLKHHLVQHTSERPFSGSYRESTFTQQENKNGHERTQHLQNSDEFKCDICSKTFSELRKLKRHVIIHMGERPYSCSYCEATFTQPGNKNRHERIQHIITKGAFKCDICSKTFSELYKLKRHVIIHMGERPYSCSYREATFTQPGNKNRHERTHHLQNSDEFKCDICSKTFSELRKLKRHVIIHMGERPYSCSYCKASFTKQGNKNRHERTHHLQNSDEFKCDICSKTFSELHKLKRHVIIHTGERPYSCSYCEAAFFYSSNKIKHEQAKHNNTAQFKCDICSKTFLYKSTLKRHLATHTGERSYSSAYCEATFFYSANKIKHEQAKHNNTAKFKCDICSKTLLSKTILKRHLVIHTGERPYSCAYCEATFKQARRRNLHERTKHHKTSKNLLCVNTYSSEDALRQHKTKEHDYQPMTIPCDLCEKEFVDSKELLDHTHQSHSEVARQQMDMIARPWEHRLYKREPEDQTSQSYMLSDD